jgi:hypothetical protein
MKIRLGDLKKIIENASLNEVSYKVSYTEKNGKQGSSIFPSEKLAQMYAKTVKNGQVELIDLNAGEDITVKQMPPASLDDLKKASKTFYDNHQSKYVKQKPVPGDDSEEERSYEQERELFGAHRAAGTSLDDFYSDLDDMKSNRRKSESIYRKYVNRLLEEKDDQEKLNHEENDSLDTQVDRFLGQYESEAKSVKTEGLNFRSMTRRFLNEAEDEDKSDDKEDEKDDSKNEEPEEPEKLTLEDIDIASFANDVARLVDNYDSLLEVRNTIVRRAKNFLNKSYDVDVLSSFENSMQNDHDISTEKSKYDLDDEHVAPDAERAGNGGGGGGSV